MNKSELIAAIAQKADLSQAAAGRALDAATSAIVEAVAAGGSVSLIGFGSFGSSSRAAREGRNPRTGETLQIAAAIVPKFSAGSAFKSAVNAPKGKKAKK